MPYLALLTSFISDKQQRCYLPLGRVARNSGLANKKRVPKAPFYRPSCAQEGDQPGMLIKESIPQLLVVGQRRVVSQQATHIAVGVLRDGKTNGRQAI